MDTKSRSYSHSKFFRTLTFLLIILSFTTIVALSLKTAFETDTDLLESSVKEDYFTSYDYRSKYTDTVNTLNTIMSDYKSEENIKQGNTISKKELELEKERLFNEYVENNHNSIEVEVSESLETIKKKFEQENEQQIKELKDNVIKQDLYRYNSLKRKLKENEGVLYYTKSGDQSLTNTEYNSLSDFKQQSSYLVINGTQKEAFPLDGAFQNIWSNWIDENTDEEQVVYIALTKSFLEQRKMEWKQTREILHNTIYMIIGLSLIILVALIYLFLVTGRRFLGDRETIMSKIDRLYTDLNIILIISIVSIWVVIIMSFYYNSFALESILLKLIVPSVVSLMASALVLVFLLSLVRHIKNKTIITHSLIYIIVKKLYIMIKDIYDSGSVAIKVAIAVIVYPFIAVMTFFMFPITIAVAVWFTHQRVKQYQQIKAGVEKIKKGEIDHKIDITQEGELKILAEDINSIGQGLNHAIENELKSERLKSELITNVSHDLRTPLTSIITYVDLLKRERDEQKRIEYIDILEQKSSRLKTLTDDLFEASKASSGNIPVSFEQIDLVSLITQGLGELDRQVIESELEFIMNTKEKVFVRADGRLLWRSLENLMTNIFKYASKGSRVYIDVLDKGEKIELSIKNISAYGLNISSDELMERFKRGDESRTSEGSGLGLSISKSLIEAQNGTFDIKIDGDLFKVIIMISKFK